MIGIGANVVKLVPWVFATALVTFAILLGQVLGYADKHQRSLMKQCMDDGHKEYECVGMFNRNR